MSRLTALQCVHVVSVALNLPGPVAVARLVELGARATTVLPPAGDPLQAYAPEWFDDLHAGQQLVTLDLKQAADREHLRGLLDEADVLVTSSRPSALARLGLDPGTTTAQHPRLCRVDVVGEAGEAAERPGHDLTYQALAGLVTDRTPLTLVADLVGAERAVTAALAALLERARTGAGVRHEVALADAAHAMAEPLRRGATSDGGLLGGGFPWYGVYPTSDGAVAVAALEAHFVSTATDALQLDPAAVTRYSLASVFRRGTTEEWCRWAGEHGVPLAPVRSGAER